MQGLPATESNSMRLLYTAFILLFCAPLLFSQEIEFTPFQGNPVLKSYASQKKLEQQAFVKRHYNIDLTNEADDLRDGLNGCPPDLPIGIILVESGKTIEVEIDTFGLAVDSTPPTIILLTDPLLNFGTAVYLDSIVTVRYSAFPGLQSIASDTIRIQYSQGGVVDTVLKIAIDIKRRSKTILADEAFVGAGGMLDYCLDDEFDFPLPRKCFQFENCFANYDGDGYQFKYFYNDSCLIYLASRFPGTDTVCVRICDAIGICDLFKIPVHIVGDTISIFSQPFFEDFSTSNGPYPSEDRWLEDDVYINQTFAKDPPSVGMATFDGLNAGGKPYELPGGGVGDQLTSKPINLAPYNANSGVFLRFFVAPKGYGQEPEDDDFIVEFRNKQLDWVQVMRIEGTGDIPFDSIPPFKFYAIKIEDPSFFHNAFQMRFKANSSPGGYGDWWHLDYIHLARGSTDANRFADIAFSTGASGILKNYTSMPWAHFKKEELNNLFLSSLFNHDNVPQDVEGSAIRIVEKTVPSTFSEVFTLDENPINLQPNSIEYFDNTLSSTLFSQFETYVQGVPFNAFRNFQTEYTLTFSAEDAEFKVNDTVSQNTIFSDYFAHDDGSAELQFFWSLAQGGEETAIQYKANVPDSLRGIRFMFPHYTFYDIEAQFFNLKVWFGNENGPVGEPVYEQELMKPYFADEQFDTLQGFTTYVLEDIFENRTPLFIPKDTIFYVGFEQLTNATRGIPIGYDINSACDCNFRKKNETQGWRPFSANDPPGAMMIRPVFGNVQNTWNSVDENFTNYSPIKLFPNPASSQLNIQLEKGQMSDFKFMVFDQLGQMIHQGELSDTVSLKGFITGTYYFQTIKKDTGEIWIEKFMVAN